MQCTRARAYARTNVRSHVQQWNATSRRFEIVKGLADIHELNGTGERAGKGGVRRWKGGGKEEGNVEGSMEEGRGE